MNFTESFDQFSSKLGTTDLALYAGVALVLYVLFKNKLDLLKPVLAGLFDKVKSVSSKPSDLVPVVVPVVSKEQVDDVFFRLVVSWKQTRDLALASNCSEAVKVADQMFPYLSPNICQKEVL